MDDWHKADIKAALEKAGCNLRQIAVEEGLEPRSSARVLYAKWGTMERAIAAKLGVAPEIIWPSRYTRQAARPERRAVPRRSGKERRTHPDRRHTA